MIAGADLSRGRSRGRTRCSRSREGRVSWAGSVSEPSGQVKPRRVSRRASLSMGPVIRADVASGSPHWLDPAATVGSHLSGYCNSVSGSKGSPEAERRTLPSPHIFRRKLGRMRWSKQCRMTGVFCKYRIRCGAAGGTRTPTPLRAHDPESNPGAVADLHSALPVEKPKGLHAITTPPCAWNSSGYGTTVAPLPTGKDMIFRRPRRRPPKGLLGSLARPCIPLLAHLLQRRLSQSAWRQAQRLRPGWIAVRRAPHEERRGADSSAMALCTPRTRKTSLLQGSWDSPMWDRGNRSRSRRRTAPGQCGRGAGATWSPTDDGDIEVPPASRASHGTLRRCHQFGSESRSSSP
jgi:hypothetical protein